MAHGRSDFGSGARWTAFAGLLFVLLFVVGLALLMNFPLRLSFPDQDWIEWYEDGGNRARQLVGVCLVIAASLAFVVYVVGFVSATDEVKDPGFSGWLAFGGGLLFAVMAILGSLTLAGVSAVLTFGPNESETPDAEVMRFLDQAGVHGLIGLAGGWSAAMCVAALAVRARSSVQLPPRLATSGVVAAILLLASPGFAPLLALPLWVLASAIVFWRRRSSPTHVA